MADTGEKDMSTEDNSYGPRLSTGNSVAHSPRACLGVCSVFRLFKLIANF